MERYFLNRDIKVFCVTAKTFPAGVQAAHQRLRSMLPSVEGRTFFGISRGTEKGAITYKAGVEEQFDREAQKYGCEIFIIRKGNYMAEIIRDWRKEESSIGQTFKKLLDSTEVDGKGYCVEVYINENDVHCMVTLK